MIPHNKPTLGKEEETAALRILRSGQLSNCEEVREFENEISKFYSSPYAVAVDDLQALLVVCEEPTNDHCEQIGFELAKIHKNTQDFKLTRKNNLCLNLDIRITFFK